MTEAHLNALSKKVIGAALDLRRELGPGLDELDYEQALSRSLTKAGIANEWQVPLPIVYKGRQLDCGYRQLVPVLYEGVELGQPFEMEFVIDGALPVMVLSVAEVTPLIEAPFRTKLRLGVWREGLLMNFNAPTLRDGLRRLGVAPRRFLERKAAMQRGLR